MLGRCKIMLGRIKNLQNKDRITEILKLTEIRVKRI